jgi:superfamily I DNA/RNA helicase
VKKIHSFELEIIMRKLLILILLSATLFIISCATIPKQSAMLSEELSGMITNARSSHLALLAEYLTGCRDRIDEFMKDTWVPKFMDNFMKQSNIIEMLNSAKNDEERQKIIRDFQEAASARIEERRNSLVDALNHVGDQLRNKIEGHYNQMQIVNDTLTAHLRSAEKVNETRDELLKTINVPIKEMIPFDKINQELDGVTTFEGKAEAFKNKINEFENILK